MADCSRYTGSAMEPRTAEDAEFVALCGADLRLSKGIAIGPEVHHAAKAETGKLVIISATQHVQLSSVIAAHTA